MFLSPSAFSARPKRDADKSSQGLVPVYRLSDSYNIATAAFSRRCEDLLIALEAINFAESASGDGRDKTQMDVATDFAPYQERVLSTLVNTTKTTGQISAEDLNFQRSFDPNLSKSLDKQSRRLLDLTGSILKASTSGSDLTPPALEDEDDVEDGWKGVIDVVDELLERADACLDEFTGIIKKLNPAQNERGAANTGKKAEFPSVYDFGRGRIAKPQLQFERSPDNQDISPFKPLLKTKPHAIVPLSESLEKPAAGDASQQPYKHPYEVEISNVRYPSTVYSPTTPQKYHPFESTTATFVDTLEGVEAMLAELKEVKEIAVDLEHHDMHSYHGLVCLMQISTRDKDWIVDTLKPWREELQILNEVFADPSIVKVLHGSTMDMIWLQRDLGLYVVGLFDTYHAALALHYPKRSLKFLLEKFVGLQAEKRYQMADWRLRPLLPGMFDYARSDTHYLLYIYDNLRNELIEHSTPEDNLVDNVLDKSKEEALQRYERSVYDAATGKGGGGWYDAISRSSVLLSREQFAVFRAVHQWRDETARSEDEGLQAVLSKQSLFRIAHAMPLDPAALLKVITPISSAVKTRASQLVEVIKEAKLSAATGPELKDVLRPQPTMATTSLQKPKPIEQSQPLVTAATAEVSRANLSQLWGPTFAQNGFSSSSTYSPSASLDSIRLSLPLPSNIAVTASATKVEPGPTEAAPTDTKPDVGQATPSNEIFTVKKFGAPQKRKSGAGDEGADPEEKGKEDEDEEESEIKVVEPGDGKRRKKNKKKKDRRSENRNQDQEEPAPFDYSAAESVYHAKPAASDKDSAAAAAPSRGRRQFNPYAKAMDAPHGMRKAKKDMGGGKSFTFRK